MIQISNHKPYKLDERTLEFAKKCRDFVCALPNSPPNQEYAKQLLRSSGSVAANYLEANDAISKKDSRHRMKICRKESKESRVWILLCMIGNDASFKNQQTELAQEATELTRIFSSIVNKPL